MMSCFQYETQPLAQSLRNVLMQLRPIPVVSMSIYYGFPGLLDF